jgi:DNA-binding MarR family transcriptional regulator
MSDTDDLATQADVFGSLFVVMQHLTRRTDAALADLDLTTKQWLLLAILAQGFRGSSPSLTEAGERYGTSRQNVKQIALGLEARGYVRLVADAHDGRTTRLELTEQARVFETPELEARGAALVRDAFTGLEPRDVRALQDIVHRWLAGLGGAAQQPAAHAEETPDG